VTCRRKNETIQRGASILLALFGLLLAGCGGSSSKESTQAAPDCVDLTGSPTADIKMLDNKFDPDCFTMSHEQGLTVRNEGTALHNFSVEGSDVDLDVPSGEATNAEAIGGILQPGDHKVSCKYHLPTMVAELKVL
jgi:plastocyanin